MTSSTAKIIAGVITLVLVVFGFLLVAPMLLALATNNVGLILLLGLFIFSVALLYRGILWLVRQIG